MKHDSFQRISSKLTKRPAEMSDISAKVFDILQANTAFPWPILETQSNRLKKDPQRLTEADLPALIPKLLEALRRFTSPEKVKGAEEELRGLIGSSPTGG